MDQQDLAALNVYSDLMTVLKERGFTDEQAAEVFLQITSQVEMEITEEVINSLSEEQLKTLDDLPADSSAKDLVDKLKLDGDLIERLRAEKTARLISEMVPSLNE